MLEILPRELSSEAWLLTSSGGSVRLCREGLHETSYELELFLVRLSLSLTDLMKGMPSDRKERLIPRLSGGWNRPKSCKRLNAQQVNSRRALQGSHHYLF